MVVLNQSDRKGQTTDLVFGTIRNMHLIDTLITKLAGTEPKKIQKRLLNIIRAGVYEFVFCPNTAEYAIVNEAVNLASEVAGKKQAGFVNAVLRNVERAIDNRNWPLLNSESSKTVPHNQSSGCRFNKNVLPDVNTFPGEYYSTAFSLPLWLVKSWLAEFGPEQTGQICFAMNRSPSVCIQVNTLKVTLDDLCAKFTEAGVDYHVVDGFISVNFKQAANTIDGFADGLFYIQDITAAKVAKLMNPAPGDNIADLCAAPGGKTMALAIRMQNTGKIIATDIDDKRLEMVKINSNRLGTDIVEAVSYNNFNSSLEKCGLFDSVLIDVPCSNSGVMARRPEVRMRIRPETITDITKTQYMLLEKAAALTKQGGKICYSTCSICPEENTKLVNRFISTDKGFEVVCEELTLPRCKQALEDGTLTKLDCDGGYVCLLRKI